MQSLSSHSFRWVALALLVIVLVAAALRLPNLDRVPPGLYHDEAVNGLDALSVMQGQRLPIFFEANGGREPLFIYLQALSIALFGPSAWALRIVSALVGILTIPVFFLLARELRLPRFDPNSLALVASAGLAVSYWHLHWSRVGLRAILLPLLLCLSFYFFFRARRTASNWSAILAGVFMGLSLYSYLAARFVPLIYLGFFILDWSRLHGARNEDPTEKPRAPFVIPALVLGVGLLVALPLGIYFLQYPAALTSRASDIALTASSDVPLAQALALNIARVVGMFFVQGDVEWRHGLALRPVLDPIAAVLFAGGLLVSLRDWRHAATQFAWLWLGVMLLPTVLSQQAPDTLRAIGAVPIVFWFVGVAWMQLSEFLSARIGGKRPVWTVAGTVLLLLGSGFFTYNDYFNTWANDPRAYRDFDGELTEIARWVNGQPGNVYLPLEVYAAPTVQFLTAARAATLSSVPAQNGNVTENPAALAIPPQANQMLSQSVLLAGGQAMLLNPSSPPALSLADSLKGKYRELTGIAQVQGDPYGVNTPAPITPRPASFEGVELAGYTLQNPTLSPKTPLELTLYWKRVGVIPHEPELFVELVNAQGNVVTHVQDALAQGLPLVRFPFGEVMPDLHTIPIEQDLPPGKYTLQISLFDPLSGERWNVNRDGTLSDSVALTSLVVSPPSATVPDTATATAAQWQNGLALDALAVDTQNFVPGDSSEWTLYWHTNTALAQDDTVFVQLQDADGNIVAQADHDPASGAFPTSAWQPNQLVADPFTLKLPANLAPGSYRMFVGWYDRASGERVPIKSPASENDAYLLYTVKL